MMRKQRSEIFKKRYENNESWKLPTSRLYRYLNNIARIINISWKIILRYLWNNKLLLWKFWILIFSHWIVKFRLCIAVRCRDERWNCWKITMKFPSPAIAKISTKIFLPVPVLVEVVVPSPQIPTVETDFMTISLTDNRDSFDSRPHHRDSIRYRNVISDDDRSFWIFLKVFCRTIVNSFTVWFIVQPRVLLEP